MKHFCITFMLILFLVDSGFTQTEARLYPITENAKFGFADSKGNIAIKPQFDRASSFSNGLAMVDIDGKKGYIDKSGKVVINPLYDDAEDFSEGLAVVCRGSRCGYIDTTGKEVIPLQFVEALSFSDGLAAVDIVTDDVNNDVSWGYINKKGEVVIAPKFHKAFEFHNGIAKVLAGKFGSKKNQRFIDKRGNYLFGSGFELSGDHVEGLIPVEVKEKWGFIDASGEKIIAAKFDHADEFSEGLANITIGEKYGYIDKTGKVVIAPQFEFSSNSYRCAHFVEGRACFERNGKIGFIDRAGTVIIEPQFEFVTKFSDGIAQVNLGAFPGTENESFPIRDNYGLIDLSGRVVYKPTNKDAAPIHQSKPVDPKMYDGWRKIQVDLFSFYVPKDVEGGKKRGIDTTVYRYESPTLNVLFDIGMMANAAPRYGTLPPPVTIDGQTAVIWHAANVSQLHIALGPGSNSINFNMIVTSNNPNLKEIAEKMFTSLRFNLKRNANE